MERLMSKYEIRQFVRVYYEMRRKGYNVNNCAQLKYMSEFNPKLFARLEANWQANRLEKE